MESFILFFILFTSVQDFLSEKISIEPTKYVELNRIDNDLLTLNVTFGYPPKYFHLLFDTSSVYSYVRGDNCIYCSSNTNMYDKSSQYFHSDNKLMSINNLRQTIKGEVAFDYMMLKIYSAMDMPFLIVNDDDFFDGVDGVLGLGFSDADTSYFSILDKLFYNNQIKEKIFSLKYEDLSAKILVGKIPDEIIDDYKNYSKCHVNLEYSNWNCKISHILPPSSDNSYDFYKAIPVDENILFASSVSYLQIPTSYIQFFIQNYFKNYPDFDQKYCRLKKEANKNYFLCDTNYFDINKAPPFLFIMNGFLYKIPQQDLFDETYSDSYNQYSSFKIIFADTPNKQWIFGHTFLKQYHTVFNKDKGEIGFYSGFKFDFTKFTSDKNEEICFYNYGVYAFFISLLVFSMAYVIYRKKKANEIIVNDHFIKDTPLKKPIMNTPKISEIK